MTELCCCNFVVWACDKMGGGGGGGSSAPLVTKVGGLKSPLPPYFSAPEYNRDSESYYNKLLYRHVMEQVWIKIHDIILQLCMPTDLPYGLSHVR